MAGPSIILSVERREGVGKGAARAARRAERVPGVLYGGAQEPVAIDVSRKELVKALRSGKFLAHLITLDHKGERQPVIPKAIQFDPVSDMPIHFDLYRVLETDQIVVDVPVHFKNQDICPGIKKGGSLNIVDHTLKLRVPAGNIPEEIVVDLDGLDIGAVIHVDNIVLPAGAELAVKDRDHTIATIQASRAAASENAEETAEG